MKKTNAMKIAFCGITAGLCTAVMLMGYLFPFATYVCPAMASVLLFPIAYEYGAKTSFTVYLAVSFLSFFLVPDYELVFMFVMVFGLFTVIKLPMDRKFKKKANYLLKFIYVNGTLFLSYFILLVIFPVQALLSEFAEYSVGFGALLVVMFDITFFLYDKAIEKMLVIYIYKLRPKLIKK